MCSYFVSVCQYVFVLLICDDMCKYVLMTFNVSVFEWGLSRMICCDCPALDVCTHVAPVKCARARIKICVAQLVQRTCGKRESNKCCHDV